jgi:hypothetical protein
MKNMKKNTIMQNMRRIINIILSNFTLAKFISAFITIVLVALLKYWISGGFTLDFNDLFNNIALGLLSWLINTGMIGFLTDFLGIRGINFNLRQFIFGFDTMKATSTSSHDAKKLKDMIHLAMESDEDLYNDDSKPLDKGKGVDRSEGVDRDDNMPLDKGKGREVEPATAPLGFIWSQVFPGVDPASVFFPQRTNPAPGFNVPGGEVPISDPICQHIDYNTRILSQFKKMDLETAIEQRNNYLKYVKLLDGKLAFAQDALTKVPEVPTTNFDIRLKNQILRDLDSMTKDKIRTEARATLLGSRIDFIESLIKK